MSCIMFSELRGDQSLAFPSHLDALNSVSLSVLRHADIDPSVKPYFSESMVLHNEIYECLQSTVCSKNSRPLTVGVLFSGGPAPGGHAVISSLVDSIKKYHPDSRCIGFIGGPQGLLKNRFRQISQEDAFTIRYTGGFDFLGTGREKIEGAFALETVLQVVRAHDLDALVVIGGDDSNTNAAIMADYFLQHGCKTVVVGVPKTIDGDLAAQELPISFGFDTATRTYSETIGNLEKDALSSKKQYFFIRIMGREASHITLECAMKTHPNMALISEEVFKNKMTLHDVVVSIADLIDERLKARKEYGVVLIPEGLIEHMFDVRELISELNSLLATIKMQRCTNFEERYSALLNLVSPSSKACLESFPTQFTHQLLLDRDSHGNVLVSKIETDKLLSFLVKKELEYRSLKDGVVRPFACQTMFCGYEGRCQYPTPFDMAYCTLLGKVTVCAIVHGLNGYLAAVDALDKDISMWKPCCIPLISMMSVEERHGAKKPVIAKVKVDLKGKAFETFEKVRRKWRLEDEYQQPGPIQYFGPKCMDERPFIISHDS